MDVKTIAIVANTDWNIFNFRLGLARALQAAGYHVLVLCPHGPYIPEIKARELAHRPLRRLHRKGKNPVHDLQLTRELRQIYRREHIDLALQYTIKPNIYGSLAAAGLPTKTISTVTGLGYTFLHRGLTAGISRSLYQLAFRFCDQVLFQNPDDQALFLQKKLVRPEKTDIVPGSGIDTQRFQPAPPRSDDGYLLFVGRLLHDKGIRELLEAAEKVLQKKPQSAILIVGDTDPGNPAAYPREDLEAFLQRYPQVRHLPHSLDIREPMRGARAVVLPSYREGLPRVLLEGLAMGKPLIATDVPGCRETVLPGRNGWLVPARDPQALADAMLACLELSEVGYQAMGQESRRLVETRFAEPIVIEKYLHWIKKLLDVST